MSRGESLRHPELSGLFVVRDEIGERASRIDAGADSHSHSSLYCRIVGRSSLSGRHTVKRQPEGLQGERVDPCRVCSLVRGDLRIVKEREADVVEAVQDPMTG